MVSTRKKRQSNRRHLSKIEDFDQDNIIGNTVSDRQENATVNEGTGDQEYADGIPGSNLAANENMVNAKTWDRQDPKRNLPAIESIIAPKIELAFRSKNASSRRGAINVTAISERGEHIGIAALFEHVSEKNKTLHVLNTND